MIGYFKPKKLRIKGRMPDIYEHKYTYWYEYEYYDEESQTYLPTPEWMYGSEAEAQLHLADNDWKHIINRELEELNELRDKLIGEEAVLKARIERHLRDRNASPSDAEAYSLGTTEKDLILTAAKHLTASESVSDPYDISADEPDIDMQDDNYITIDDEDEFLWTRIQESDDPLAPMLEALKDMRARIEYLNAKEEQTKKLLSEHKWLSETISRRSYHIPFSQDRVETEECDKGKRYYIDLEQDRDGVSKRIRGETIQELKERLLIEEDRIREEQGAYPEARDNIDAVRLARERIAMLSAAETRHLIDLFELSVFAGESDRYEARKRIFDLLELSDKLEESKVNEIRRQRCILKDIEANWPDDNWDSSAYSEYIKAFIKRTGKKKSELASEAGLDPSNLSKSLKGKQRPRRDTALRLALAMGLHLDKIKEFMILAGYPFPSGGTDQRVIDLFIKERYTPSEVLSSLMEDKDNKED